MEQVMCETAAWATEITLVEFLHVWVFMAKANFLTAVNMPKGSATVNIGMEAVNDWLTATTDTAARASHDFDEIVMGFSRLNVIQELAGVA